MSPRNWTRISLAVLVGIFSIVVMRWWLAPGESSKPEEGRQAKRAEQQVPSPPRNQVPGPRATQGPQPGAKIATGLRPGEVDATQSPPGPHNDGSPRRTPPPSQAQYYDFTTLEGLIAGTKDLDWKVRWDAVNTLGTNKEPGGIEALSERALYDDNSHPRWRSLWALRSIDPTGAETVPILREALADPNPTVARNAAIALAFFGQAEAGPQLLEGLASDNPFIRWESTFSLRQVGSPEIADALLPYLRADIEPSERVRGETALALGYMKSPEVIAPLLDVLRKDPSPGVRWRAAMTLSKVGDSAVIEDLEQIMVAEQDAKVKKQIEDTLTKFSG